MTLKEKLEKYIEQLARYRIDATNSAYLPGTTEEIKLDNEYFKGEASAFDTCYEQLKKILAEE